MSLVNHIFAPLILYLCLAVHCKTFREASKPRAEQVRAGDAIPTPGTRGASAGSGSRPGKRLLGALVHSRCVFLHILSFFVFLFIPFSLFLFFVFLSLPFFSLPFFLFLHFSPLSSFFSLFLFYLLFLLLHFFALFFLILPFFLSLFLPFFIFLFFVLISILV